MILCEEMTQLQAKKMLLFSVLGSQRPHTLFSGLRLIIEIKPLVTAFRRGITYVFKCRRLSYEGLKI